MKSETHSIKKQSTFDAIDSDDDKPFDDDGIQDLSKIMPQASDHTSEIIDQALSGLPTRLDPWWIVDETSTTSLDGKTMW